jgi:hypothetical protein
METLHKGDVVRGIAMMMIMMLVIMVKRNRNCGVDVVHNTACTTS